MRNAWAIFLTLAFTSGSVPADAPDFETQVLPVLTRAGCNSGACHGAAIGRGGFKLSLLGYDPSADYDNLLFEYHGRRVNLARPEKSLVLRKPGGKIVHEGGVKLPAGGDAFNLVLDWIKAGAPRGGERRLLALEVSPAKSRLTAPGDNVQLKIAARFNDGRSEDVTRWALLTPADPAALRVSADGEVTANRRGQHALMVRFLGEVSAATVTIPLHAEPAAAKDWPRANFIDDHIHQTLRELHLSPSPLADDATFLRRVFLDLIGTLPEPKEVQAFGSDRAGNKRSRCIDQLLERPEFVDHWAYKWGDLLRIESQRLQPQGAAAFHQWLREQIAKNTPLDRLAARLLSATGDGFESGAVNFSRVPRDALVHAEYVSQVFLGVRLQCANCHNHPLDRWTQDDYHGLAAVFAPLSRSGRAVELKDRGEVIHPRTGKAARPRIPGGPFLTADDADARQKLTAWLADGQNPFFARAAVNRLWRELMGRGLVEPVDDHRASNPPTHPELLDALARDLVEHGFDVKHTIRMIAKSSAYQRSSLSNATNKNDDRFYAKAVVRALPPQVLVDAVVKVTGVAEKLGTLPPQTRAIALGDSRVPSQPLDLLGRCSRDNDCVTVNPAGGLPLALHIIHGPWLNAKISNPQGRLHQRLREKRSVDDIVTEFYLVALSRPPTAAEMQHWQRRLSDERSLEDFLWGLLNSSEFGSNH